jgi:PAS domain S-box-containing protein
MTAMKSLIEHSSDVVSLVSPAGEVLYTSASSAGLLGYPPEEIVGRNAFDLIHPEDRDQSNCALGEVLARPAGPRKVEVRVLRRDGGWSWVESTISNLLDEPRVGAIVVTSREIRAGRSAEEKPRQTDELRRSDARLAEFAHAVAHDLREPLRTISMFTELLIDEAGLDAQGKEFAQFIVDGTTRMSALFEGLRTFAVNGFDDPSQPVDLAQILRGVLQDLGHAIATSNATVTVGPLPFVQGNSKHLTRVFQNLIANAIKYRAEAHVEIHVTGERLGSDWILRVKDNGIGIAPEQHERVFALFKRLHGPEIPGAGIGLAVCRKIIEAMGGSIWVESELGSGSTFCFTVAAVKEAGTGAAVVDSDRYAGETRASGVDARSTRNSTQRGGMSRVASTG